MSKWIRNSVTLENDVTINVGDCAIIKKAYDPNSDLFPSYNVRFPKVKWDSRMNRMIGRSYTIIQINLIKGVLVDDDGWKWWVPLAICEFKSSPANSLIDGLKLVIGSELYFKKYGIGRLCTGNIVAFSDGSTLTLSKIIWALYGQAINNTPKQFTKTQKAILILLKDQYREKDFP